MLKRIARSRWIRLYLLFAILPLCSCPCPEADYCGEGPPYCLDILTTHPKSNPIKFDYQMQAILFANGELLVTDDDYFSYTEYSLNDICQSDTVVDVRYNYTDTDNFLLVVTPEKCCWLNESYEVHEEFADIGPDSSRLINAVSADIDSLNRVFVVDTGDSTVKVYDSDGTFIRRWSDIGYPYHLEISKEHVYILDKSRNAIFEYDFEGQLLRPVVAGEYFEDIVAFDVSDSESYLVVDYEGERIVGVNSSGSIWDEKTDYCLMDVSFTIGKITSVVYGGDMYDYYSAVDMNFGYIIFFGDNTFNCIF